MSSHGRKIIGSLTSPFTRVVRALCEELKLPYELEITPPFNKMTPEQDAFIRANNPLMKVPVLIEDDRHIIDSRVIAGHLLRAYGSQAKDFHIPAADDTGYENRITVIYGALDAGVLRFILSGSHPEIQMGKAYMAKSLARIACAFEWLDRQETKENRFGYAEIALVCALEWFKKRNVFAWDTYSKVSTLYAHHRDRPSLVATRIPETI